MRVRANGSMRDTVAVPDPLVVPDALSEGQSEAELMRQVAAGEIGGLLFDPLLVLLRHEFLRRDGSAITKLQHGHRGRLLTSAPINRRRMVAIEFGM